MRGHLGFFELGDRFKRLSDLGDQLNNFRGVVDFDIFRLDWNVEWLTEGDILRKARKARPLLGGEDTLVRRMA